MTATLPLVDRPTAPPLATRLGRVIRLHFANPQATIVVPWTILGFIFVVNLAIWVLVAAATQPGRVDIDGFQYSGASAYIFVYMLVVAIQSMNQTFPLAQGFSVTRRDFYVGTALIYALLSVAYATAFTILAAVEDATGGWGVNGRMFSAVYFGSGAGPERFLIVLAGFLFFFFIGLATGATYVRWRQYGMFIGWGAVIVLLVGAAALVTWANAWGAVGSAIETLGYPGVAGVLLGIAALCAVGGYLVFRRATPRQ